MQKSKTLQFYFWARKSGYYSTELRKKDDKMIFEYFSIYIQS